MMELFERFSKVVINERNLRPILPKKGLFVCFQYDHHFVYLEISESFCGINKNCQERIDLWIKGDTATIELIISGKEKLRKLESRSELKIIGKLKDILVLETFFSLCEQRISA